MADKFTTSHYSNIDIKRLTGEEKLTQNGEALPFDVSDFWQWAYSNLMRNMQRGVLAEYIVKAALEYGGCDVNSDVRYAMEPFDLKGPKITVPKSKEQGYSRIEVKCTGYTQTWNTRNPNKETVPVFSIAPAKLPDESGDYRDDAPRQRNSDLYVFCIYNGEKGDDILEMDMWDFYVIPTFVLNEEFGMQKTVSLNRLKTLISKRVNFEGLCGEIQAVCEVVSDNNIG